MSCLCPSQDFLNAKKRIIVEKQFTLAFKPEKKNHLSPVSGENWRQLSSVLESLSKGLCYLSLQHLAEHDVPWFVIMLEGTGYWH